MIGNPEKIFPIFFSVWIVLGIASYYFFFIRKDYAFKRKYFPGFVIFTGLLFATIVYLMSPAPQVLYMMVPAVALVTFLNIKNTKFCRSCGKTIFNQGFVSKMTFCPKCGAILDEQQDNPQNKEGMGQ